MSLELWLSSIAQVIFINVGMLVVGVAWLFRTLLGIGP